MEASRTANETERLKSLYDFEILDTGPEPSFDALTELAAHICETPMASITLIDENRQWFKSKVGLSASETSRDIAFCAHSIQEKDLLVVEDALADERFAANPLVTGDPKIRFYAGAPLVMSDGNVLGTLCVIDQVPRKLTALQTEALRVLSLQVIAQLELRRSLRVKSEAELQLRASELSYRRLFEAARDGILILELTTGRITDVNPFLEELLSFPKAEMLGKTVGELSPFRDILSNQVMLERLQKDGYVRYEDLPLKRSDGRHMAVEFVCNVYVVGDKQVIQCNVRDITARKDAEQQLALLSACVSKMNDIVLITEAEPVTEPGPRIVFVNEAFEKLTGYAPAEVMGKTPRILQGAKSDKGVLAEIHEALANGESIQRQVINYRKDGTEYWMDIDITAVVNGAGKCTHFVAIERDITESKKLKESLKLFRALMDRSPDAIEVIDPATGRFLDVNETAHRRLGYSREEMLSLTIADIAATEEGPVSIREAAEEVRKTGVRIVESLHVRKDGSTFPVEINVQHIDLGQSYMVAVVRDITERREAESVRQLMETRYRTLFDYAPDGIVIADPESNYVEANSSICRMLGYTREEMIGLNARDIVSSEETGQVEVAIETIKSKLEYHREWEFKRKDGSFFRADVIATLMPDGNLLGMIRDITERKEAEERIAEQATFLDKAQDAIFVRNLEGKMLFWNKGAERMYGWTRQEVVDRNVDEILYTEPTKLAEAYRLTVSRGDWHGELKHFTKGKEELVIESRWTLIRDHAGRPKSVLAINTDITEKKKIEAQFMRAQRMESIGTLAGGIAHDLNNILAPILMSIDMLKLTATDAQAKSILETIEVSAKRGADVVRQVLSFARGLEGQRIEIQPKHLFKDVESIIKDTFPKDIRLHFSIPEETWMILGDPTQVHQILLNLCVNARDAMPHGGKLNLSVENSVMDEHYVTMHAEAKVGRYVLITVTDSGTGMAPALLDKIFEPFFTTKDLNKGTGLGLSTVMAIVKSHDGIINVYSEPGKGTTFKVYLPAMENSPEARRQQEIEASLPRGNGETILLVDDEASILTITSQTLQAFGYRVLTASDGAEAVAMYALHRAEIAVVLTDMMMPVMDGAATIYALTKMNPGIKIISASGLNLNGSEPQVFGMAVKHFLAKPYTAGTLLKTMRAVLEEGAGGRGVMRDSILQREPETKAEANGVKTP